MVDIKQINSGIGTIRQTKFDLLLTVDVLPLDQALAIVVEIMTGNTRNANKLTKHLRAQSSKINKAVDSLEGAQYQLAKGLNEKNNGKNNGK
jgi:hypothetical protein